MRHITPDQVATSIVALASRRSLLGLLGGAAVAPGLVDLMETRARNRRRRKDKLTRKEKRCKRESNACKAYRSTFCASLWAGEAAACTADLHACCGHIAKCRYEAEVDCYASSPWLVT